MSVIQIYALNSVPAFFLCVNFNNMEANLRIVSWVPVLAHYVHTCAYFSTLQALQIYPDICGEKTCLYLILANSEYSAVYRKW